MIKYFIQVATFLMILQGGHTIGHHDHLHYELPEWEELQEPSINTSGYTSCNTGESVQY